MKSGRLVRKCSRNWECFWDERTMVKEEILEMEKRDVRDGSIRTNVVQEVTMRFGWWTWEAVKTMVQMENRDRYRGWHAVYLNKPPSSLTADMSNPSWHWWCHNPSQTPLYVACHQPRTWVFHAEGDKCRFGLYVALGTKVCSNESPWAMHLEVWVLPESISGLMTLCRWPH